MLSGDAHHLFFLGLFWFVLIDEAEIRRALEICGISITKLAVYLERDRGYVESQLKDVRPLYHRDLINKLPKRFTQWYAFLLLMKVGLPEELQQASLYEYAMQSYEQQLTQLSPFEQKKETA